MTTYIIFFGNAKSEIEADSVINIGTKVSFYRGTERIAYFDLPFGTAFGYQLKPEEPDEFLGEVRSMYPEFEINRRGATK